MPSTTPRPLPPHPYRTPPRRPGWRTDLAASADATWRTACYLAVAVACATWVLATYRGGQLLLNLATAL